VDEKIEQTNGEWRMANGANGLAAGQNKGVEIYPRFRGLLARCSYLLP